MARKSRQAQGKRRFASPPEVHAENFEQQHQGASESIDHAQAAIHRGDCADALESLVDVARHVGAAASEAVAGGGAGSDEFRRVKLLRHELSSVEGDFKSTCVRRGRK